MPVFTERLQTIGFFILLGGALLLAAFMFLPFVELIALSGILAVLFRPLFLRMSKYFESDNIAAVTAVVLGLLIVLLPLLLIGFTLYREIIHVYDNVKNGSFSLDQATIVANLPESLRGLAQNFLGDVGSRLSSLAGSTVASITGVLSNVFNFFFGAFIVFFSLFYFLRDGDSIKHFVGQIFPLSEAHETKLTDDLEQAIGGIVKGQFLMALIQGSVATVGFLIFGIPQPFLWGAFTVVAALIPNFGTSLALIPAILYLFLTQHTGAGIGMLLWGGLAVGLIDNFLGPKIISSRTKLHPLLVLFSVIGGLQLFGVLGFLIGPIVSAVLMTLLGIYMGDNKKAA